MKVFTIRRQCKIYHTGEVDVHALRLGARNDAEAWVRGGLGPDAAVLIYPAAQVADGVRVKVRSTAPPR